MNARVPTFQQQNDINFLKELGNWLLVWGWTQEDLNGTSVWKIPPQYKTELWRARLGGGDHYSLSSAIFFQVKISQYFAEEEV